MNKKILSALLLFCMILLSFAGCGNKNHTEAGADGLTLTFDSYSIYSDALLKVTKTEENKTPGKLIVPAEEGKTLGELLSAADVLSFEPVLDGGSFEGWMEFEYTATSAKSGHYSRISGDTLYTTEQLLSEVMPEHDVVYVAKWSEIPMEDYYTSEIKTGDTATAGSFSFSSNGGQIHFKEPAEEYDSTYYTYWLELGQTLHDVMGTDTWAQLISVEKEGAVFTGWTIYEGEAIYWASESAEMEGIEEFLYYADGEDKTYIIIKNCSIYGSNVSTEEMCSLDFKDRSYYAVANWEEQK